MNLLQIFLFFISSTLVCFSDSQIYHLKSSGFYSISRICDYSGTICIKSNINNIQINEDTILFKEHVLFSTFIDSIIGKFSLPFENIAYADYLHFCRQNNVDSCKSQNINKFATLIMLHKLLTCKSANDGSVGDIWTIPYFWHYVKPNPRHTIKFISNGLNLSEIKPPKEFSRYQSYADIDRTPYLYWSDFLSETQKYETSDQGKFYSFGWCSEREMAFVSLLSLLNFETNIVTFDNHSTTEVYTDFIGLERKSVFFRVIIDNTFDNIEWIEFKSDKRIKPVPTDWYNRKAKCSSELNRLKNLSIAPISSNRVALQIEKYFNSYK